METQGDTGRPLRTTSILVLPGVLPEKDAPGFSGQVGRRCEAWSGRSRFAPRSGEPGAAHDENRMQQKDNVGSEDEAGTERRSPGVGAGTARPASPEASVTCEHFVTQAKRPAVLFKPDQVACLLLVIK